MAKHKYISTPEKMWELFCDYRNHIKENPIQKVEQTKMPQKLSASMMLAMKPAQVKKFMQQTIALPLQRPLTIEGFENYCWEKGIINDLGDYFSNKDEKYSDFSTICQRIRNVIRQDQIEGGMAGIYNPSITQRLNNLAEKISTDQSIVIRPMDPEEEAELKKALHNGTKAD
jgi:hypothetical protein